jgi:formimidoylglutamate deiminase
MERAVLAPDSEPESLARRLFTNATEVGAQSLGAPSGILEHGRPADFFTIDLDDLSMAGTDEGSLLSHVVFSCERTAIRDVYVGGKPVISESRHAFQPEIIERFAAVQRKLWASAA